MSDIPTLLLCDPVLTRYAAAEIWPDEEDGGRVEVLGMSITEDGVVQVRVEDGDERRDVTADDLVGVVSDGRLARDD